MKTVIVYSALHTGTWFTCNAIASCKKEPFTKSDAWVREVYGSTVEDLSVKDGLTQKWCNDLLSRQQHLSPDPFPEETDIVILQTHQRRLSPLYNFLLKNIPEIPIVCPMRDPLLSLHTRIWREAGSFENLTNQSEWERKHRVHDQINSLKRILRIRYACHLFPIDIPKLKKEENRIQALEKLASYCGLKPTQQLKDISKIWAPINATPGGANPQRKHHAINDSEFMALKDMILQKDEVGIKKIIGPEYEELRKLFSDSNSLAALNKIGYTDGFFWL